MPDAKNISIPTGLHRQLKYIAALEDRTVKEIVKELVTSYIESKSEALDLKRVFQESPADSRD